MNNLAWILATTENAELRDGAAAVAFANEAVEIAGERADLLDTLAAAYAEDGDLAKAIKTAQQAVKLAQEDQQDTMATAIEKNLRAYRARLAAPAE